MQNSNNQGPPFEIYKPAKTWGLGKTPIKLPALEKYFSCLSKYSDCKILLLGYSQVFKYNTRGKEFTFIQNN